MYPTDDRNLYVRVSVVGIELLTIDARIVIASVETYLRFAEAVNRLNLSENGTKLTKLQEGSSRAFLVDLGSSISPASYAILSGSVPPFVFVINRICGLILKRKGMDVECQHQTPLVVSMSF